MSADSTVQPPPPTAPPAVDPVVPPEEPGQERDGGPPTTAPTADRSDTTAGTEGRPAGPPTTAEPGGAPGTTAEVVEAPPSAPDSTGDVAGPLVLALVIAAALVGAALVTLLHRRRREPRAPQRAPAARPAPPAVDGQLALAAIDVRDRVGNPALADRLAAGLAAGGWTTLAPAGRPFDPTRHAAVDREPTRDAGLDGIVASVERVGYLAPDGELHRPPEVVVYAYHGDEEHP
jgi:hypothetical protein